MKRCRWTIDALTPSRTSRRFWRLFSELPSTFDEMPNARFSFSRATLRTQACNLKIGGEDDIYSAHIGLDIAPWRSLKERSTMSGTGWQPPEYDADNS